MTITVYANNQTPYRILGVEVELIQDTIYVSQGGKQKPILTASAKDYSLQLIMYRKFIVHTEKVWRFVRHE